MAEDDFHIYRKNSENVFFTKACVVRAGSFQGAGEAAALRFTGMNRALCDGELIIVRADGSHGNMWLMRASVPAASLERV
jgi:hypothetical protein